MWVCNVSGKACWNGGWSSGVSVRARCVVRCWCKVKRCKLDICDDSTKNIGSFVSVDGGPK